MSDADPGHRPGVAPDGDSGSGQRVRGVTGVVLAGGLGRRLGGVEKALIAVREQTLLAHVIARLRPQVDELLVNANREIGRYEAYGLPVVGDVIAGLVGPLAGLHAGLVRATHDLVLSVPCDAPSLPDDLVARLHARMQYAQAEIAIARSQGRIHPVFCLCRRELAGDLAAYLEAGGRAVRTWVESRRLAIEDFDDEPDAFENVNTNDDVRRLESRCAPDAG